MKHPPSTTSVVDMGSKSRKSGICGLPAGEIDPGDVNEGLGLPTPEFCSLSISVL